MPCPVISLLPKWDRNKSRIVTQLGHPTPDIQSSTTPARSQVANPRDLSAQPTDNTNHRAVRHSNGAALSPDLRERLRAHQRIRGERRSPSRRRPGRARPRRPRRRAPPARSRTHRRSSASQHPAPAARVIAPPPSGRRTRGSSSPASRRCPAIPSQRCGRGGRRPWRRGEMWTRMRQRNRSKPHTRLDEERCGSDCASLARTTRRKLLLFDLAIWMWWWWAVEGCPATVLGPALLEPS